MLSRYRFESIGKVRVGSEFRTYYTREPEMFQYRDDEGGIHVDTDKVRRFVEANSQKIDDDDEL